MTGIVAIVGDCSMAQASAASQAAAGLIHHGEQTQAIFLPDILAVETREKRHREGSCGLTHDKKGRKIVMLDGQIDRFDPDPGAMSSPTRLARLISQQGPSILSNAYGSFVLVVVDYAAKTIHMARDALGNRSIFYASQRDQFVFASEENALLRLGVSSEIDASRVNSFMAVGQPAEGSTFFNKIRELPAGCWLSWRNGKTEIHRYYHPARTASTFRLNPDEAAGRMRQLLAQAVQRQLSLTDETAAVSMSGGLDSSALAVLARENRPVVAISYQFPTIAECDETQWIDDICEHAKIESVKINADQFQPLCDGDLDDINPNSPERSIYHQLRKGVADLATARGMSTLFSGDFGDHLYLNWPNWVTDALRRGEVGLACKEWLNCWRKKKNRLAAITGLKRHPVCAPWLLTPVPDAGHSELHPALGLRAARDASAFRNTFLRHGIDHSLPFRDRELAEFMVSLPAHYLYRDNCYKWLTRRAFSNDLPASVLQRPSATRVTAFLRRAVYERNPQMLRDQLQRYDAWRQYVSPKFVDNWLSEQSTSNGFLVLWRALCFSRWVDRHY